MDVCLSGMLTCFCSLVHTGRNSSGVFAFPAVNLGLFISKQSKRGFLVLANISLACCLQLKLAEPILSSQNFGKTEAALAIIKVPVGFTVL